MGKVKAVTYADYGDESVLTVSEVDAPVRKAHEVEIAVKAAGVNPVDYKIRAGYIKSWPTEFPVIPGWDVAGTVIAAPEDSGFVAGDEVYAYTRAAFDMAEERPESKGEVIGLRDGGYSQRVVVPAWKVAKKPSTASFSQAASVPLAALTAHQALFAHGGLAAGNTVLILGGSGGVGSYAVGLAKARGATVLTSCSSRNVDYVKGLGADVVLDYSKGPIGDQVPAGTTVDVVFDAVGGDATADGLALLKDGGVIVSIANWGVGDMAGKVGKVGKSFLVRPSSEELTEIAGLIDAGKVKLPELTELPLEKAAEAHKASASGRTRGKIVLTM